MITVSAGAAAVVVSANPLARADNGMLQCYRPDVQTKTCQSIAAYERTGPGAYVNMATIPVSKDATLETHTPVIIKGGAVCGAIRSEDITAGVLRLRGRAVDTATAKAALERIAEGVRPLTGQEVCTRYEQSGLDFIARVTVAGSRRPDQDRLVKWIALSDGYTIAP